MAIFESIMIDPSGRKFPSSPNFVLNERLR
jgi:hypothetical protein